MDVNARAAPPTWGARARALDVDASSSSSSKAALSAPGPWPLGSPRSPADPTGTEAAAHCNNANSAEVSPAASLSNSLSSSLGLSSSFVLASHLLAAPTPINTPNFGSPYIHRAARAGVASAEARESQTENLGEIIDFRKWLVRLRPDRRWVEGDEVEEDCAVNIGDENEDDNVEGDEGEDAEQEENLDDDDVENTGDSERKGQAIPQPRPQ